MSRWPDEMKSALDLREEWLLLVQTAFVISEQSAKAFLKQAAGLQQPKNLSDLLGRRIQVVEYLIELPDAVDISVDDEEYDEAWLSLLPEDFNLQVDCPMCLKRFQSTEDLANHQCE